MRDTPDALMLFAAGFGTRMGELTRSRPKPLVEVAGRPLIDHALALARGAHVARVVANTHYLGAQISCHLTGSEVLISDESDSILETGGGLRRALPLLGPGPVFTLNTDAVWTGPNPLDTLRTGWDSGRMGALLALVPLSRATGHPPKGDFSLAPDGRLSRGGDLVFTGAEIVDPRGLAAIPEPAFSLNLLWDRMLSEGRLFGTIHSGGWCDVGRPDCIPLAEALLRDADA